jgi:hypothetical protein
MSSQGANSATSGMVGYQWNQVVMRDSSDWTTYRKQARVYDNNVTTPTRAPSASPWIIYGNNFRLTFLNGNRKCTGCTGHVFNLNGVSLPAPSS